jgi:hypothetical protein
MATGIETLPPRTTTGLKRMELDFTSHNTIFQAAGQCNASCPICAQQHMSGACVLSVGHAGEHKCNHDHMWTTIPTEAPGPH